MIINVRFNEIKPNMKKRQKEWLYKEGKNNKGKFNSIKQNRESNLFLVS